MFRSGWKLRTTIQMIGAIVAATVAMRKSPAMVPSGPRRVREAISCQSALRSATDDADECEDDAEYPVAEDDREPERGAVAELELVEEDRADVKADEVRGVPGSAMGEQIHLVEGFDRHDQPHHGRRKNRWADHGQHDVPDLLALTRPVDASALDTLSDDRLQRGVHEEDHQRGPVRDVDEDDGEHGPGGLAEPSLSGQAHRGKESVQHSDGGREYEQPDHADDHRGDDRRPD